MDVNKYDFLLHPIKDLTKNWNIDIAHVLEDYTSELEKMQFSFDGGKTSLNFAEASYLIQGTACVWGKKVEYLHSLVYKTLEMIRKNKEGQATGNQDDVNQNQANAAFDDPEDKFIEINEGGSGKSKKVTTQDDVTVQMALPAEVIDKSDADSRGSGLLTVKGEVFNYYSDLWCNNSVQRSNGTSMFTKQLGFVDDIINTTAESGGNKQTVATDDNDNHSMEAMDDDYHEDDDNDPFPAPVVADEGEAAFDQILNEVEEHVSVVMMRQTRQRTKPVEDPVEDKRPKIEPLNPYEVCKLWVPKPLCKGKPLRLPASLRQNVRKRKITNPAKDVSLFSDFLESMKGTFFVKQEFEPFVLEKKRRMALWKEMKLAHVKPDPIGMADDDDDVFAADVNQNGDVIKIEDYDDDAMDDAPELDDLIGDVTAHSQPPIASPDLNELSTYEDLVRHHVDKFYSSAKQFVQETSLSQRVKQWEQSISPYLEEQEKRPEFDIHTYGDEMIASFQDLGQERNFEDILKGDDRWSICRKFAATLQLANDCNFHLESDESSVNTLKLKLLSNHKSRDRFQDNVIHSDN